MLQLISVLEYKGFPTCIVMATLVMATPVGSLTIVD
jgi:hypothetical protein